MVPVRAVLVYGALALAIAAPIAVAGMSPYLAWRGPIYIASGFAGIAALALLLIQPVLAGGYLPGLTPRQGRVIHRWTGILLVVLVIGHVAGLYVTSPPDALDALLLRSPTPFSIWGVIAMWALFAAASLAALRSLFRLGPRVWRVGHSALAALVVIGTVGHVLLVDATMGPLSKAAFCTLVCVATIKVLIDLRAWALLLRRHPSADRA